MDLPSSDEIKSIGGGLGMLSPRAPRMGLNTQQRIKSPSPGPQRPNQIKTPRYNSIQTVENGARLVGTSEVGTPISRSTRVSNTPGQSSILDSIPNNKSSIPPAILPNMRTPIPTVFETPEVKEIPVKPRDPFIPSKRNIPDFSKLTDEEKASRWAEFEWQFNQIKDYLPPGTDFKIPNSKENTLGEAQAIYNQYLDNIAKYKFINEECDKNRFYMVLFWAITEIVLILFGISAANGYTNLQIMLSSQYDLLLIRLGEKKWLESGGGGSTSPIYEIVVSSVITLGIFIFFKFVTSMLGPETSNSVSTYLIGEMIRKRQVSKPNTGPLVGVGDILEMLNGLKSTMAGGKGLDVMSMMGNLMGNINI